MPSYHEVIISDAANRKHDGARIMLTGGTIVAHHVANPEDDAEVYVRITADDEWHLAGYDNRRIVGIRLRKGKFKPFEFRFAPDDERGIHKQINVFYRGRVWRIKFTQCGLSAFATVDTLREQALKSKVTTLHLGTFKLPSGKDAWADIYRKYESEAEEAIKEFYALAEGNG